MKAFRFRLFLSFLLLTPFVWLGGQERQAPPKAQQEPEFALTFGKTAGSQDREVGMPVFFTQRVGGPKVSEIQIHFTVPKLVLQYKRAELVEGARHSGLQIKVRESDSSTGEAVLNASFALTNPAVDTFPNGQLATITFAIIGPPPGGGAIVLKPDVWIDGKPVTGEKLLTRVEDATIEIDPSFFMPCFFFTH